MNGAIALQTDGDWRCRGPFGQFGEMKQIHGFKLVFPTDALAVVGKALQAAASAGAKQQKPEY